MTTSKPPQPTQRRSVAATRAERRAAVSETPRAARSHDARLAAALRSRSTIGRGCVRPSVTPAASKAAPATGARGPGSEGRDESRPRSLGPQPCRALRASGAVVCNRRRGADDMLTCPPPHAPRHNRPSSSAPGSAASAASDSTASGTSPSGVSTSTFSSSATTTLPQSLSYRPRSLRYADCGHDPLAYRCYRGAAYPQTRRSAHCLPPD